MWCSWNWFLRVYGKVLRKIWNRTITFRTLRNNFSTGSLTPHFASRTKNCWNYNFFENYLFLELEGGSVGLWAIYTCIYVYIYVYVCMYVCMYVCIFSDFQQNFAYVERKSLIVVKTAFYLSNRTFRGKKLKCLLLFLDNESFFRTLRQNFSAGLSKLHLSSSEKRCGIYKILENDFFQTLS